MLANQLSCKVACIGPVRDTRADGTARTGVCVPAAYVTDCSVAEDAELPAEPGKAQKSTSCVNVLAEDEMLEENRQQRSGPCGLDRQGGTTWLALKSPRPELRCRFCTQQTTSRNQSTGLNAYGGDQDNYRGG